MDWAGPEHAAQVVRRLLVVAGWPLGMQMQMLMGDRDGNGGFQ